MDIVSFIFLNKFEINLKNIGTFNIMMYRIEWRFLLTNLKSNGYWFEEKDKTMLEDSIKYLNKQYPGEILHWLGNK